MDWAKSYSSSWRVYRVNRDTWADAEMLENVDSVSITKTADGSLLESGSLEITGEVEPDYYRIVMTAEQSGEVVRVDVATLLFGVTGGKYDYGRIAQKLDGHSVLYPASTTTIIAGEYAPAGVDGVKYAADLLAGAINAPVETMGSFTLNDHLVHEMGSTVLEAVWAVLNAGPDGGWVIQIDGRGVVHIVPRPTEPALILDSTSTRLLTNGIEYTTDISAIPNRYIVIVDENRTVAVNSDASSSISTVSRGYNVDMVDESPTAVDGETLSAYARRRLKEESVMKDERTYPREYAPNVYMYSIVRASIEGLQGDLRVGSQTITCDKGIKVQEKASREISLW